MPTSTLSGVELINYGPMTTTWTAPASCTDSISLAGVAITQILHPPQYLERCDFDEWEGAPRYGDCLPDGSRMDDYVRTRTTIANPAAFVPYYSPGYHCPADWTTAGVAEMSADGSISATGAFSMTEFTLGFGVGTTEIEPSPTSNPWYNKMAHALDEGETAVLCCPSGFTAWEYGACYSNFPIESIQSSTLCQPIYSQWGEVVPDTFTYVNEVVTGSDYSATGTSPPEISFTATLIFADETSEPRSEGLHDEVAPSSLYTGHTQIPMIVLVRGSDDDSGGGGDDSGDDSGDGSDGDESGGDGDDGNAAPGGRTAIGAALGTLAAVWGVAGLLGAMLMAPV